MPKQTFLMPQLKGRNLPGEAGEALEDLRRQVQFALQQIVNEVDQLRGNRGAPVLRAALDVGGHRLMHLGEPVEGADALRADLGLRKPNMTATFYDAAGLAIRNVRDALQETDAPPLRQIRSELLARLATDLARVVNDNTAETITGLWTFDRDPSAPFAVTSGSAVVTNLDSERWNGRTYAEATFTATGTGFTVNPTGTARYALLGTAVMLFLPTLTGTSNATTFTVTGVPAAIQPTQTSFAPIRVTDTGVDALGIARLNAGSGTIDLFATVALAGWTAAGTKTLHAPWLAYGRL